MKTLIKTHGGPDSIPKKKAGSVEKVEKTAFVISLVDILRAANDNDYSKVAKILQSDMTKAVFSTFSTLPAFFFGIESGPPCVFIRVFNLDRDKILI